MSLRPRIARQSPAKMGRKREGNSEAHLIIIRRLPCAVYGFAPPSDPHHLQRNIDHMPAGMGRTHDDRWAIPLSRKAHDEMHHGKEAVRMGEEAWLASKGVQGRELALALWACREGGLDDYLRVMMRHFQWKRLQARTGGFS